MFNISIDFTVPTKICKLIRNRNYSKNIFNYKFIQNKYNLRITNKLLNSYEFDKQLDDYTILYYSWWYSFAVIMYKNIFYFVKIINNKYYINQSENLLFLLREQYLYSDLIKHIY